MSKGQKSHHWTSHDSKMSDKDVPIHYTPPKIAKHNEAESPIFQKDQLHTSGECSQQDGGQFPSTHHENPYQYSQSWEVPHFQPYSNNNSSENSSAQFHYNYGPPMPVPTRASSSFESYGSNQGAYHAPHYVVSGPIITYPFPPHAMPPNAYFPAWGPPPKPIEYVKKIKSTDVLCGRGGATNSHPGNRSFRELVKRHQGRYLRAKKRDKPSVASFIVDLVRERGGRFLRRSDSTTSQGEVLWVDIGDERAREKTCQALREGAPELRRRRRTPSFSDEEDKDESPKKKIATSCDDEIKSLEKKLSPKSVTSQDECPTRKVESPSDSRDDSEIVTMKEGKTNMRKEKDFEDEDGPIVIRPCERLMRGPVRAVNLSGLSSREQELYLHGFLPPHPPIKKSTRRKRIITASDRRSPFSDEEPLETWEV